MRLLGNFTGAATSIFSRAAIALALVLLTMPAASGRAGEEGAPSRQAVRKSPAAPMIAAEAAPASDSKDSAARQVRQLQTLAARGDFDAFVRAAIQSGHNESADAQLQILAAEALLSIGDSTDAERMALTAAIKSLDEKKPQLAQRAIKLWTIARLRQGASLETPRLAEVFQRIGQGDSSLTALRFWRQQLGGKSPYRLAASSRQTRLNMKRTSIANSGASYELDAVAVEINRTGLPMVFIDTGAQHTLITTEVARAAGVVIGKEATQLVGFSTFSARPAVLPRLRLGELTIYDVPVLVGDSAALGLSKGQGALGTDLMHHLRLTLDLPGRSLTAEPIGTRDNAQQPSTESWDIPLWTFSRACLAQGQLPNGRYARTLIDTGNCVGTFVSRRWTSGLDQGREGADGAPRPRMRNFHLAGLQLGNETLPRWPVAGTLPRDLERMGAIDLVIGYDLLWQYEVTVDLRRRLLRLREARPAERAMSQSRDVSPQR